MSSFKYIYTYINDRIIFYAPRASYSGGYAPRVHVRGSPPFQYSVACLLGHRMRPEPLVCHRRTQLEGHLRTKYWQKMFAEAPELFIRARDYHSGHFPSYSRFFFLKVVPKFPPQCLGGTTMEAAYAGMPCYHFTATNLAAAGQAVERLGFKGLPRGAAFKEGGAQMTKSATCSLGFPRERPFCFMRVMGMPRWAFGCVGSLIVQPSVASMANYI